MQNPQRVNASCRTYITSSAVLLTGNRGTIRIHWYFHSTSCSQFKGEFQSANDARNRSYFSHFNIENICLNLVATNYLGIILSLLMKETSTRYEFEIFCRICSNSRATGRISAFQQDFTEDSALQATLKFGKSR